MLISKTVINMITHRTYILASTSSSRYNILKNAGLRFRKTKPLCNEEEIKNKICKKNKPSLVAKKLSFEKAKSVSKTKKYNNHYVIGCDTLIYLNKTIFNKAKSLKEARTKIKKLSGKKHKIVSGLTVCRKGKKVWQCSSTTDVKIRKLNQYQIDKYLKQTGSQVLSSVGCYQIESLGPNIIEDIKGDFFNVMGLPLFKLLKYVSKNKWKNFM